MRAWLKITSGEIRKKETVNVAYDEAVSILEVKLFISGDVSFTCTGGNW